MPFLLSSPHLEESFVIKGELDLSAFFLLDQDNKGGQKVRVI